MTTRKTAIGYIKRFDREAGYGFLVSETIDGDVFIHIEQLQNFGVSGVSDTARITFEVKSSDRGFAVERIVSIESYEDDPAQASAPGMPSGLRPARIKWYDPERGFGFARCFGLDADVYVGKSAISNSSFEELKPGDAVCVRLVEAPRGLTAVAIYPWEMALGMDLASAVSGS